MSLANLSRSFPAERAKNDEGPGTPPKETGRTVRSYGPASQ